MRYLILILLALCLCSPTDVKREIDESLIGTWVAENGEKYTFGEEEYSYVKGGLELPINESGEWYVIGNEIIFNDSYNAYYEIQGKTVHICIVLLSNGGKFLCREYRKQ